MKFYGLFSVVGRIPGRCSGISAVEAPSLPHRDYKYTKFSKKTSIPALSPPKKHPSRPQRRLPTGRKLRSTPSPSSRDHPAAACGARPAPANETTRPQPAEHAAAQADERASITTGHSPFRIGTLRPLRPAAYRNPAPEITRPQPAEHTQPQLTKPPGRSLRSTPSPSQRSLPAAACGARRGASRRAGLRRGRLRPARLLGVAPLPSRDTGRHPASDPTAPQHSLPTPSIPRRPTPPPLPVPQHPCTPFPATRPAARHGTTPPSDPPQPRPPAARLLFSARRAPRHTGPPRKTPGTPHPATGHPTTRRSRCRSAERHRPVSLPKGASGNRRQRQPGRRPARAFHSDAFRHPPAPSAAFRYRPTTASSSSTVTGSRRSPSMRHPSSVTSRSSSMRMPPKSR